jgi:glycerol-3-phosphate cytidylyltransferase-like family protein
MSTGYLANCFDLVNVRDLDLIEQARRFCSRLVLGVYSDDFAEHRTGRRPLVPVGERMALVSHLRGVDGVVEHGSDAVDLSAYPVVFAVVGDPAPHFRTTTLLLPSRSTASPALREALEPVSREDVA